MISKIGLNSFNRFNKIEYIQETDILNVVKDYTILGYIAKTQDCNFGYTPPLSIDNVIALIITK